MFQEADLKQKLAGLETYEKELSHMKTSEITTLEETRKNMIEWYKSAIEEWRINVSLFTRISMEPYYLNLFSFNILFLTIICLLRPKKMVECISKVLKNLKLVIK